MAKVFTSDELLDVTSMHIDCDRKLETCIHADHYEFAVICTLFNSITPLWS